MRIRYWVKFTEVNQPELYSYKTFDEFWHEIRERMMRYSLRLEWIIQE